MASASNDGTAPDPWHAQLGALGAFIRAQRQLADLSLREMAALTRISNAYLSQVERGLHQPSLTVLRAIADALGLTTDQLLAKAGWTRAVADDVPPGQQANTEASIRNDTGTLCGLAYPFQRNTAGATMPPTPPEGEVFDEIYFAVFAHDDLKGIAYFDPEPPLAKEIIAAGEWLDGAYRAIFQGAHGNFADLGFNTFG